MNLKSNKKLLLIFTNFINIAKEVKEEDERALMAIRIGIKMKSPLEGPNKIIRSYL